MSVALRQQYEYQPLKSALSIRLIALHSAPDACSDLRCDVIEIDLLDDTNFHPPYAALSYAWGANAKTHSLQCGKYYLPITTSLDAALRAVRKTSWTLLLWADAVSINQADTEERNAQVANMIYIYSRSSSVLVWTGEDDESRSGAKCLNWLQMLGKDPWVALQYELRAPEVKLLEAFFDRDWFKRRWTVQEVAVAAHAFVICGVNRVSWYDFIGGVAALRVRHDAIAGDAYHDNLAKLCTIEVLNRRYRKRGETLPATREGPSLLQVLLQFDASLCSDDRDRVFSLIRLADLDDTQLNELSPIMDYHLSAEEMYKYLAEILLQKSDHYSLLHFVAAFRQENLEQLTHPSWVPDWRFSSRFKPLLHPTFQCGLGREAKTHIEEDGSLLIRGCIYDSVSSGTHHLMHSDAVVKELVGASRALVENDIDEAMNSLRYRDFHSLNIAWERFQGPLDNVANLLTASRTIEAISQEVKASPTDHENQIRKEEMQRRVESCGTFLSSYKRSIRVKTLRGRKLFQTAGGNAGIGPADLKGLDAVVILFGLRTPFILRRDTARDGWRIVGDAYVSGITEEPIADGDIFPRDFKIV